nr:hypothetical protein [Neobacillus sp. Marseille-Q6967]
MKETVFKKLVRFFLKRGYHQLTYQSSANPLSLLSPLADMIGVTRQVTVQAYQFGDGFTNSIFPTSGTLMASLAVAGVPWIKWAKWMLPLLLIWCNCRRTKSIFFYNSLTST